LERANDESGHLLARYGITRTIERTRRIAPHGYMSLGQSIDEPVEDVRREDVAEPLERRYWRIWFT
jgi:hypothetical protein